MGSGHTQTYYPGALGSIIAALSASHPRLRLSCRVYQAAENRICAVIDCLPALCGAANAERKLYRLPLSEKLNTGPRIVVSQVPISRPASCAARSHQTVSPP